MIQRRKGGGGGNQEPRKDAGPELQDMKLAGGCCLLLYQVTKHIYH